jgi:hypothetical protein
MGTVEPASEPPSGLLNDTRAEPTVVRMLLGNQLRRLRETLVVSNERAGYEIRASRSKISRMENGRVSFKERDVADLLTLYGVSDQQLRTVMLDLAKRSNAPGWWAKYSDILPDWFEMYLGLEASASILRTFELQFVHGLFQTEDYARAVMVRGHASAPDNEISRRVSLRMKRQDLLLGQDPPQVWAIVDEAVLRRPVGGREVMRAQLHRLLEVSEIPHVTIQVMPFGHGSHAAMGGSFTLLRFNEPDLPDVVYIEQLTSALYIETRSEVDHYLEVVNRISTEALTPTASLRFISKVVTEI